MSVHDGHRQRVKNRFLQEGLSGFDDLHIVELLLFYCVPRRDTNLLAHQLIERFGSLHRILSAPASELEKIDGINRNVSTFLSLVTAICAEAQIRKNKEVSIIHSFDEAGMIIRDLLANKRNENVCMMCLDAKNQILCTEILGEGSINSANIPVRKIVERAIATNAVTVILGHNHPGGLARASDEDVGTTLYVEKALRSVDIILADHIVVSETDFASMATMGLYRAGINGGFDK